MLRKGHQKLCISQFSSQYSTPNAHATRTSTKNQPVPFHIYITLLDSNNPLHAPTFQFSPMPTCRHPIGMAPPPQQASQSRSHSQEPSTSTSTQTYTQTPVLRLRATGPSPSSTVQNRARIQWASDVIDNEGMGRKRSKGIYSSSFLATTNLFSTALPEPFISED